MSDDLPQDKLPTSLQESVLCILAFGQERGQIAAGLVDPKLFEPPYDDIARRAIEYRQKYGQAPGKDHIDDLFDHVLSDPENKRAPLYQRILMALYKQSDGLNELYVLDRIGEFVRRQTYKGVIYRAGMRIQQGGDGVADDVESILNEAYKFRAENNSPGIFLDQRSALSFMDETAYDMLKLGIGPFDYRDICPTRGELLTFIAPRGRGKSGFATHCTAMALLQHWRVADITLEMSEQRKTQRIFQNLLAIPKRGEDYQQTIFTLDKDGYMDGLDRETRKPIMALDNPKAYKYLKEQQDLWADHLSRLNVKGFPSGTLTMRKLRAHLDFLEQVHGFIPDLLVVDYPMIMALDPDNTRESLGRIYVELRGLVQERNMAGVALHQSTREGETATNLRSQHTSEDISIIGTSDIVLTYNATEPERQMDLARLFAAKVRNDQSDVLVHITQNYKTGQFVLQAIPGSKKYWETFGTFKLLIPGGDSSAGGV